MKKITYIIGAALMLAAVSCTERENWEQISPADGQQKITLNFFSGELATKADGRLAVSREDYVREINYFIFPATEQSVEGEDGQTTVSAVVADDAEYAYKGTFLVETGKEFNLKYVASFTPTDEEFAKIFPDGATMAKVFAIANYVDKDGANNDMESYNTTLPEDAKTWKALHDLEVGATFFYDDKDPDFLLRWPHVLQPTAENLFFTMVGEADLELKKTAASEVEIPLERLASKVTVAFTYEDCMEQKKDKKGNVYEIINWVPQSNAGETRVYLSNAIERTTIGGPLSRPLVADSDDTATKPLGDGTRDIFEYAYNFMSKITTTDEDGNKVAHFYTYPIQMEEGDDNQPYLKLVLPWYGYKYYGEATNPEFNPNDPDWVLYKQKEVYYKIVLPSKTINEGNRIYEFKVKVNIIGSDREVKIIGEEYVVKDWLTRDPIQSNVATGRYISLEIPKDHYDMYVDKIDINFVSSGKVIAQIDSIYQMNLSGSSPQFDMFMKDDDVVASPDLLSAKGISEDDIEGWVTIPDESSYLQIEHAMDNRMKINGGRNPAFDMSPYVYRVTLHLEEAGEDTAFDRTIWITQYPSMFVTSVKSNGSVWVNKSTFDPSNYSTDSQGIQATTVYNDNRNAIGSVASKETALITSRNNNGYNMIVHPTILDSSLKMGDGTSFILGDSRNSSGGPLNNINGLTNYKETRTDVAAVVSPAFMIASSYGKTSPMSFDRAKERCASYQENGYPAGRWRLPSPGEIEFLVTLSNYRFIPSLFDGTYWAANGRYYNSSNSTWNNGGTTSQYVRCIYDVWYWGEAPAATGEAAEGWLGFYDNK